MDSGKNLAFNLPSFKNSFHFQHKLDIRSEDPESMVVRMLTFLRVLKYKPTSNIDNPYVKV